MPPANSAAWILEPPGELHIRSTEYNSPSQDELVIKVWKAFTSKQNEAVAIQPFDAKVRGHAYIHVPYPFILGNGVAGTVEEVGPGVTRFRKGDRVVSDTPTYQAKATKYGAWQKYVTSREATTAKIAESTTFEDAAAIPFALLTAVAALQLALGMRKPDTGRRRGKALVWSASGSVGGYAVQYASSAGYDVVGTASPAKFDYVRSLGAATVLDYKDEQIVPKLKDLGPFDFIMLASGGEKAAKAISDILQPTGGTFASTIPQR
ncbi:hypothetical protein PHISP_06884 [Aspergillus sp. HF37]|nr:hypothetical protein PHISP_06884 [Aspergillus sp. HF37]